MRHNCPRQRRPTSQSIFIIDMINNWPYNHQILVTSLLRCVGSRLVAMCVHMLYEVSTVTASYGLFIQNRKMAKWRRLLLSSFICFFFAAYFLNYWKFHDWLSHKLANFVFISELWQRFTICENPDHHRIDFNQFMFWPASVAQRQSVGLGRSRVRNSFVPSGFSLRQGN